MDLLKSEKAAIDSNPNLSPLEKFERKKMLNEQLKDPIDRKAEKECDSIELGREYVRHLIKNTSRNWLEEEQRLHDLREAAELFKWRIHQQAEHEKRLRNEQALVVSMMKTKLIEPLM